MRKRQLYRDLYENLQKKQISLIIGARQTGKTTLMKQLENALLKEKKATFFISLEDPKIKELLNQHPEKLFEIIPLINKNAKQYVFIDEIQYLNDPSNFLKYHFDKYQDSIKLVVSGSSAFYINKKFTDSLAGRKRIFKLYTLSLEELIIFRGKDELLPFIGKQNIPLIYRNVINNFLIEYLIYGGYPEVITEENPTEKKQIIKELATSYIQKDINESGINYPEIYMKLMMIISSQVGNLFTYHKLAKDLGKSSPTIESYVTQMRKSFHLSMISPYFNNISKELRKLPKIYFNDIGLRNYFVNNFDAPSLRNDIGNLFENFIFRRFLEKYDELDIQFWRTQKQNEVDFIIQKNKAYEVKYRQSSYKESKYKFFKENYPEMPFQLITFDNCLEMDL